MCFMFSIHFFALHCFVVVVVAVMLVVVAVWLSGNIVGQINEVTLHRAGLVLRWVTVRGYTISVFNQVTQANLAWSSLLGR